MVESQSRYSIVERLTQRKLEVMNEKASLSEETTEKEQNIDKLKKEFENWKKDIQEDIKRDERSHEIKIEMAAQDSKNLKEQMVEKEKFFDEQIKAIEEALGSIEEISKSAPVSN